MKFKFCSGGDCPLWALAGLHALSSLPLPIFKTLLQHILEEQPEDGAKEILKDTHLSSRDECARAVAVARWVLRQTWRGSCPSAQLARDLVVLAVPRAHAQAFAAAADEGRAPYEAHVRANGFMVNKVVDTSISPGPDGSKDTIQLNIVTEDIFSGDRFNKKIFLDEHSVNTLLQELKNAYKRMEEIDPMVIS